MQTHTTIETGTYGAKRQSVKGANPRERLVALMKRHPDAEPAELQEMMFDIIAKNDRMLATVVEYWFANNHRQIVMGMRETEAEKAERATLRATVRARAVEQTKTAIVEKIKTEARIMLLDLTMANGKALRDCTGAECAKAGGWLSAVAAKVKPGQKVGAALSEADVRKLWKP